MTALHLNRIWHGSLYPQLSGDIIDWNFESILGFFVETCAHTLFSPNVIIHCIEPVRFYNVQCTVQTNNLMWLSSVVSLFTTVELIIILAKTLTFISTFTRILEVFVPLIILSKSKKNNIFVIVFTCSIASQRYQTWYGNNYLNLINYQAGQKKGEVLVSLHRATLHIVARHCNTKSGTKSGTHRQTDTDRHTHSDVYRVAPQLKIFM